MLTPTDKPWYLSKTVIVGFIMIIVGMFGIRSIDEASMGELYDQSSKFIEIGLGILAILGRLGATQTIKLPSWMPGGTPADLGTPATYVPPSVNPPTAGGLATYVPPPVDPTLDNLQAAG